MTRNIFNPALSEDERIDSLLSQLTIEEKLESLTSGGVVCERLGISMKGVGGEAAHGVEARHDQWNAHEPSITTSFPQPIGMSATWDPELLEQAGEVTGIEARGIEDGQNGQGLSRWAPTVDLERDPRWGRNEEGYGEDATLTGEMAGAYIRGMRGNDPYYIRCGATLKHFYANNTENGRGWKNSTIPPREREELYLEPFRRCIEAGAVGVMTAYNRINGLPGILNPENQKILKDRFGVMHIVSDGGALGLVRNITHQCGTHAESLAQAIHAGVDSMSDGPFLTNPAAREAYELGLLTEADVNRALRNVLRVKLRLGFFDPENPYARYSAADVDTQNARNVSLRMAEESLVLLKNEDGALPMKVSEAKAVTVIGPVADQWYQDWYGGIPPYRKTLLDGIRELCGEGGSPEIHFADGLDRVTLSAAGRPICVDAGQRLILGNPGDEPEVFVREDWGEGRHTFRSSQSGKYLNTSFSDDPDADTGSAYVNKDRAFDWFVLEMFYMEPQPDGGFSFSNRFHAPLFLQERDGETRIMSDPGLKNAAPLYPDAKPLSIHVEEVHDGIKEAISAARKATLNGEPLILALGSCPMVDAKEELDRTSIALPPRAQELLEAVAENHDQIRLVLISNFPYTLGGMEQNPNIRSILWSATGGQDMGTAIANALFGLCAPSGRLPQTWYASDADLPDINDYRIIETGRTYRYFPGKVLWPFGYGLTYSEFKYSDFLVEKIDRGLRLSVVITNTGDVTSDEVVQFYGHSADSRIRQPLRQLIGFCHVHDVEPGESYEVELDIPLSEFELYDVIREKKVLPDGEYTIYAGRHSLDQAVVQKIQIDGDKTLAMIARDLSKRHRADHADSLDGIDLVEGAFGYYAVSVANSQFGVPERIPKKSRHAAVLVYRDCVLPENADSIGFMMKSSEGCEVEVFVGEGRKTTRIGSFKGSTSSHTVSAVFRENSLKEGDPQPTEWPAVWDEIRIPVKLPEGTPKKFTLTLKLHGDVKLLWIKS